jgi:replicative DNA helicase
MEATGQKEQEIENRKDKRIQMEGTQQSQMIDQRKNDLLPINFEQQNQNEQAPVA